MITDFYLGLILFYSPPKAPSIYASLGSYSTRGVGGGASGVTLRLCRQVKSGVGKATPGRGSWSAQHMCRSGRCRASTEKSTDVSRFFNEFDCKAALRGENNNVTLLLKVATCEICKFGSDFTFQ